MVEWACRGGDVSFAKGRASLQQAISWRHGVYLSGLVAKGRTSLQQAISWRHGAYLSGLVAKGRASLQQAISWRHGAYLSGLVESWWKESLKRLSQLL
eukprot:1146078-Pelagomonas_calceolata.AAC.4